MVTLMVGVLLVAVSAVGFGFALFGRRPVPQPAMSVSGAHLGPPPAELVPSIAGSADDAAFIDDDWGDDDRVDSGRAGVLPASIWRRMLQREPSADHQPASDVTLSPWVRVRSALLLTLIVTGLAAIIGIVTSILVVGIVLLVT